MSSNLYWEQVKPVKGKMLTANDDTGLKLILREEYGWPLDITLTKNDVGMLRGIKMSGNKSAAQLIEKITKYGEVRVYEAE